MGLARACHKCTSDDYSELEQKIRHIYDIHHLITNDETVKAWLSTDDFFTILSAVHGNDTPVHKKSAEWCHFPLASHEIISAFSDLWTQLEATWNGNFKVLIYEELPSKEVLEICFETLKGRLADYDSWLEAQAAG